MNIESIIRKAGELLVSDFRKLQASSSKEKFDLVTDSDEKIESFLISEISKVYPRDNIFSEEIGSIEKSSNRRWIIDPIDGTADFVFGVPYFAISIALETESGIEEAYVFNPISDELYFSSRAEGKSFLNGNNIHVSVTEAVSESLISFGFSANPKNMEKYLHEWKELMNSCKKAMPLITPALTICNVARGRTDGYIDLGSSMEGKAAAGLILQNAGGKITGYDSTGFDYREKGHICSNGKIDLNSYRKGGSDGID